MSKIRIAVLALCAITLTAPVSATKVITAVGLLDTGFVPVPSGYQQKVTITSTGAYDGGYAPEVEWDRSITYLYWDFGELTGNETETGASCNKKCTSGYYTTLIGTGTKFIVRNERGYDYCYLGEAVLGTSDCAIVPDYFQSYVSLYAQTANPLDTITVTFSDATAIPEPASWALMVAGFGLVGSAVRRRRVPLTA